jgi:hypothetical protein
LRELAAVLAGRLGWSTEQRDREVADTVADLRANHGISLDESVEAHHGGAK